MIKAIYNFSYHRITGFMVLLAFISFMLFILLILPNEAARSRTYFGDTSAPDTQLFYTGEDLYEIAHNFGAEGRTYYIRSRFTFDVLWPLAYGIFLWSSIAYLGRNLKNSKRGYLVFLPILAIILDFMENTGASLVMFIYPEKIPVLPSIVPFFTLSKWLLIGTSFLLLLFLMINKIYCKILPSN